MPAFTRIFTKAWKSVFFRGLCFGHRQMTSGNRKQNRKENGPCRRIPQEVEGNRPTVATPPRPPRLGTSLRACGAGVGQVGFQQSPGGEQGVRAADGKEASCSVCQGDRGDT